LVSIDRLILLEDDEFEEEVFSGLGFFFTTFGKKIVIFM
jgi:hypothetical protein